MAVPVPVSNDVNSWKFLLRRLSRSFKHRTPTVGEMALIAPCLSAFVDAYPQLLYRFMPLASYPPGGYAFWFRKLSQVLAQGGATRMTGTLLTKLTDLCSGLNVSRYTT
jgi:hypothetical protein